MSTIGRSLPRLDSEEQLRGLCRYGADEYMEGMLYGAFKWSGYAHAKIISVDTSEAEKLEGVRCVITAKDMACNSYGDVKEDCTFFAEKKVLSYSDAIAAVAADTPEIAAKAVELIRVEYSELEGVFSIDRALEPDAPILHNNSNIADELFFALGNTEKGMSSSRYVFEQTFTTPEVEHASIEPHAGIAWMDLNGILSIRSSVQRVFTVAAHVSRAVGIPQSRVHVTASKVGGGFGGKNDLTCEAAASVMATKTGRPVKMEYTREDEFRHTTVRHASRIRIKSGVDVDGRLIARSVEVCLDCGPYMSWGGITLMKATVHACGPYDIPNMSSHGLLVYTNNGTGGAMRGFGVPQACFAYESHSDFIARSIGMDPIEFRRKNLVGPESKGITGMNLRCVTAAQTLERVLELEKEGEG
jgi:CO/xanthine dehydrogenase Mo-binding subunit